MSQWYQSDWLSYFIFQIYLSQTNIWSNADCFERYENGRSILMAFSVFQNGLDLVIWVWMCLTSWFCLESKTISLKIGISFDCCDWTRYCHVVCNSISIVFGWNHDDNCYNSNESVLVLSVDSIEVVEVLASAPFG